MVNRTLDILILEVPLVYANILCSKVCLVLVFINFGKFSDIISSNTFLFFPLFFSSGHSSFCYSQPLKFPYSSQILSSFKKKKSFFLLCFTLKMSIDIFKFTHVFFCEVWSTTNLIQSIFISHMVLSLFGVQFESFS